MLAIICIAAIAFFQGAAAMHPVNGTCPHCSDPVNPCLTAGAGPVNIACPGSDFYVTCTATVCATNYCPFGMIFNDYEDKCTHCLHGQTWHPDLKRCLCASGTGMNPVMHKCVLCGPSTISVYGQCRCKSGYKFWNYHKNNPASAPAPHKCMDCPLTTTPFGDNCMCNKMSLWFDVMRMKCRPCAHGSMFSKIHGRCMCRKAGYIIATALQQCVKAANTPAPTLALG